MAQWHYCAVSAPVSTAHLARWPVGRERPRHAREWTLALTLALAGHALLLAGLPAWEAAEGAPRPGSEGAAAAVLVVRTLTPAQAQDEPGAGSPDAQPAHPAQPARAAHRPAGQAAGVAPPSAPLREPATGPDPAGRADTPAPAALADTPAGADADDLAPGSARAQAYAGAPPPVWATRLPGDFSARYLLQRGEEPARAVTLRFEAAQGLYSLHLAGAAAGRGPEQASQGRLEASGLSPERFLDRRRARAAAAANFDRARARITYSGSGVAQPLFAGAQDRLSWIVQLAAVVEAEPARWRERERLALYVTGASGDAQLWVFTVRGRTSLEGPAGLLPDLLHLVREPERPYDLRVEAWLDPAQQHLPARLLLSPVPGGQPLLWSRIP